MQEAKNKLFVGNLSYEVDDEALFNLFNKLEDVEILEAKIVVDRFNEGRSKGFGFVTLKTDAMADKAVTELNNTEFAGRNIFVNIARPQEKRDGANRSFGGGNSGGGRRY